MAINDKIYNPFQRSERLFCSVSTNGFLSKIKSNSEKNSDITRRTVVCKLIKFCCARRNTGSKDWRLDLPIIKVPIQRKSNPKCHA